MATSSLLRARKLRRGPPSTSVSTPNRDVSLKAAGASATDALPHCIMRIRAPRVSAMANCPSIEPHPTPRPRPPRALEATDPHAHQALAAHGRRAPRALSRELGRPRAPAEPSRCPRDGARRRLDVVEEPPPGGRRRGHRRSARDRQGPPSPATSWGPKLRRSGPPHAFCGGVRSLHGDRRRERSTRAPNDRRCPRHHGWRRGGAGDCDSPSTPPQRSPSSYSNTHKEAPE
jgi:hypothetical protein